MKRIKEKAPATPASVTSANLNNHNQDITNSARVQEVIAAIINNCNKYREYGRRRSPHNFFSSLNCESTESDIKKVCLAMLEAAQREYSLEALDRKIVFGFFGLLADEYVAGLKEYANNTIA